MLAANCDGVKLLEFHRISPPPGSVSSIDLPLTFSDAFWIPFSNTQKVFLYKLPSISTPYFLDSLLPNLKASLSLSLQHFFPLAGTFLFPNQLGSRPYICCRDGNSVALTIAESTGDLDHLIGVNKKRLINVEEFHPLVPDLEKDEATGTSVLALQMTMFPGSGICFGITYKHVVADGKSIASFLNTWASTCKNGSVMPANAELPVIDRSLISDPDGKILDTYLKICHALLEEAALKDQEAKQATASEVKVRVRGTFVINKREIEKLRQWIVKRAAGNASNEELHLSTFVVACSLIWVNIIRSEAAVRKIDDEASDDLCYFGQVVGCRDRYEFQSIVPSAYFGNCLAYGCVSAVTRTELEGENGFLSAVRAVGSKIKELARDGVMTGAHNWLANFLDLGMNGKIYTVAGGPILRVYGLDFGWGRPDKVEVVSIGASKAISVAESVEDAGGIEVGLALVEAQMKAFVSIFEQSKNKYCN